MNKDEQKMVDLAKEINSRDAEGMYYAPETIELAQVVLQHFQPKHGGLTMEEWERGFVDNIGKRIRDGKPLSEKQNARFTKVWEKALKPRTGLCTPQTPAKHKAIAGLVRQWEKDPKRNKQLEDARRWVSETFHSEDGDTVRTLRLRKGWSQTRLAEELSTSQSHVARIERGTENLSIETCRKLSRVLGIVGEELHSCD